MNRICKNCGWVHFGVTREYAEDEVKRFNTYYNTLTKKKQKEFYGGKGSSIRQYEHCMVCDSLYTNFRRALKKEVPYGSTLSPIIYEPKNNKSNSKI